MANWKTTIKYKLQPTYNYYKVYYSALQEENAQ